MKLIFYIVKQVHNSCHLLALNSPSIIYAVVAMRCTGGCSGGGGGGGCDVPLVLDKLLSFRCCRLLQSLGLGDPL